MKEIDCNEESLQLLLEAWVFQQIFYSKHQKNFLMHYENEEIIFNFSNTLEER